MTLNELEHTPENLDESQTSYGDRRRTDWSPEKAIFGAAEGSPGRTQEVEEVHQGHQGKPTVIPAIIQTEDMSTQFALTALVDSGCTGSCINVGVV